MICYFPLYPAQITLLWICWNQSKMWKCWQFSFVPLEVFLKNTFSCSAWCHTQCCFLYVWVQSQIYLSALFFFLIAWRDFYLIVAGVEMTMIWLNLQFVLQQVSYSCWNDLPLQRMDFILFCLLCNHLTAHKSQTKCWSGCRAAWLLFGMHI